MNYQGEKYNHYLLRRYGQQLGAITALLFICFLAGIGGAL